jgi:hypothetical protein
LRMCNVGVGTAFCVAVVCTDLQIERAAPFAVPAGVLRHDQILSCILERRFMQQSRLPVLA